MISFRDVLYNLLIVIIAFFVLIVVVFFLFAEITFYDLRPFLAKMRRSLNPPFHTIQMVSIYQVKDKPKLALPI